MNTARVSERDHADADAHVDGPRPSTLEDRLRRLFADGADELPAYGSGRTAERLRWLAAVSARDLSLGRVAEAHLDATTILRDAGRTPVPGRLYGVWASEAPGARLRLTETPSGTVVHGRKAFCTGVGLVDRALVTATTETGQVVLVDLDARDRSWVVDTGDWVTPAFAETRTATIELERVELEADQLVGTADWYLERVGFWHGALAPAACWAGGALGLAAHCRSGARGRELDVHVLALLGEIEGARWELEMALDAAAAAIDASPDDAAVAHLTAARARTVIERLVTLVVDRAVRAFGPRLLAQDEWAARRVAELQLYVRQHHGARDHAVLGRLSLDGASERVDRVAP